MSERSEHPCKTPSKAENWFHLDDLEDLREAERMLGSLAGLLVRERQAVGALDPAQLDAINADKQAWADRLAQLAKRARPETSVVVRDESAEHMALREKVRGLADRVRILGHANAALLRDAIDAVSESLGLGNPASTYDQRARRVNALRAFTGKAA